MADKDDFIMQEVEADEQRLLEAIEDGYIVIPQWLRDMVGEA